MALVIDSTDYFRQVVSYVHLNPVAAGLVADPVDYVNSGHRELVGRRVARLIDLPSVLVEFEDHLDNGALENFSRWVRAVAEARWIDQGLEKLPWWKSAREKDEITPPETHPEAETFDVRRLEEERTACKLEEFAQLFERLSEYAIEDLASPLKMSCLVQGRVELTLLGVLRYGFKASEISGLLKKHPSSMPRWLNQGLRWEREDPAFLARVNSLDQQISAAIRNIE